MPGKKTERATAVRVRRILPAAYEGWTPAVEPVTVAEPTRQPAEKRSGTSPADAEPADEARAGAHADTPTAAEPAPDRAVVAGEVRDLRTALRAAVAARLPATLRGARASPGLRGWRALVVVAVLAALVSGGVWWRSRAVPAAVPPVASNAVSSTHSAAGKKTTARRIVVDVAGKVRQPGIVRLPAGSRVHDAIAAAGGLRPGAKTAGLNLARKLADGEQIVVGKPRAASGGPSGPGATNGSGAKLDLNAATLEQLDELPGVGPVLAQRILDFRAEHGRFESVEQLDRVSGIGPARLADISPKVQV